MKQWYENFKEKRLQYGISQNCVALEAGITRQYLNELENGKRMPHSKLKNKLDIVLERFNPDCPLTLLLDYVRVRFPTTDAKEIIEGLLQMKMIYEDYAFYGYEEQYRFADMYVMVSQDESKGVLLELKGKGSRQLEGILNAQGRTWYDFLNWYWKSKAYSNG